MTMMVVIDVQFKFLTIPKWYGMGPRMKFLLFLVLPMVTPHRLSQLKKLSVTLVKTLQDHAVRLSLKESDVARLDKTTWSKYDKLETHVQQMINTVDETVQKQVSREYVNYKK